MFCITQMTRRLALAFAIAGGLSAVATAGAIIVTPTVTPVGSLFHYDYSIANNSPDDVVLVDISVPPASGAVQNLTAPSGFLTAFDSGLGLVSFIEDTAFFGSTPLDGFAFDSFYPPGTTMFQATILNSATGDLYTMSGPTTAPVPEPGSGGLLAASMLALLLRRKLRRNDG